MRPLALLLPLCLGLLTGCQSSGDHRHTWVRPGYSTPPIRMVAVAVLAYEEDTRAAYENSMAAALRGRGVNARATYPYINTQTILSNKSEAVERVKSLDVDGVLVIRLADRNLLRDVRIDPATPVTAMKPWQGWFDFFTTPSAFSASPQIIRSGSPFGAQATFYASPSGTPVWSDTILPVGSRDPNIFAAEIVSGLRLVRLVP